MRTFRIIGIAACFFFVVTSIFTAAYMHNIFNLAPGIIFGIFGWVGIKNLKKHDANNNDKK